MFARLTMIASGATLAAFHLGDWDEALRCHALVTAGLGERGEALTSGFTAPWPAVGSISPSSSLPLRFESSAPSFTPP